MHTKYVQNCGKLTDVFFAAFHFNLRLTYAWIRFKAILQACILKIFTTNEIFKIAIGEEAAHPSP